MPEKNLPKKITIDDINSIVDCTRSAESALKDPHVSAKELGGWIEDLIPYVGVLSSLFPLIEDLQVKYKRITGESYQPEPHNELAESFLDSYIAFVNARDAEIRPNQEGIEPKLNIYLPGEIALTILKKEPIN